MSGGPSRMLTGPRVYRIVWLPGTDRLRGACYCGTSYECGDPIELWTWLLAHPDRHGAGGSDSAPEPDPEPRRQPAHRDCQPLPVPG